MGRVLDEATIEPQQARNLVTMSDCDHIYPAEIEEEERRMIGGSDSEGPHRYAYNFFFSTLTKIITLTEYQLTLNTTLTFNQSS